MALLHTVHVGTVQLETVRCMMATASPNIAGYCSLKASNAPGFSFRMWLS
jgi:hypothetical protein